MDKKLSKTRINKNIKERKSLEDKLAKAHKDQHDKLVEQRRIKREKIFKTIRLFSINALIWTNVFIWGYLHITYKSAMYAPATARPVKESCMGRVCILEDGTRKFITLRTVQAQEPSIEDKIRAYDWDDNLMTAIAKWESSGYACIFNPKALNDKYNADGSEDRGLFQVNSNTFKDFQRRHGEEMEKLEIVSFDDMFDVDKNIAMIGMIVKEQGYEAFSSYNSGVFQSCGGLY